MKDGTIGIRRSITFESSLGVVPASRILRLKRCKRSSSSAISIDDLPGTLLVEILCRLACQKLVFQCKCVSKRWCSLLSDPYFVHRFLRVQSEKQSPKIRTLINPKADEFNGASDDPVEVWSKRFSLSFLPPRKEGEKLVVVATYKDLVLCCVSNEEQWDDHVDHYYICNLYLKQWVALPPTQARPQRVEGVPIGFICDPYYKVDTQQQQHIIKFNAAYRFKVVRIHPLHHWTFSHLPKCRVEIFSSDTGEWRDSIVSSPPVAPVGSEDIRFYRAFAYNGMLYWSTNINILIGLDPFMINNNKSCSSNGDDYEYHIIECDTPWSGYGLFTVHCLGVCRRGCLRMCHLHKPTKSLVVWELSKEEQVAAAANGNGKFCLKHRTVYSLDPKMFTDIGPKIYDELFSFDPNDDDILYLRLHYKSPYYFRCNIRTRRWSKIKMQAEFTTPDRCLFSFVLPWWPTPVPTLPQHAHGNWWKD